jgi:putative membrane protein
MLWIKALHIIFVITWFAGIFYLPRLFIYHVGASDAISVERFKVMERRLFNGIMTPSAVFALLFGGTLLAQYGIGGGSPWMHAKLFLVGVLVVHHIYLGHLTREFAHDRNRHSDTFYRWLNEIPAVPVLVLVVFLVVLKPSF